MTHESALDWGHRHGSFPLELAARKALGPETTQADWWRVCPRGDWLLGQWLSLPAETREATNLAIQRATVRVVARALRRGLRALRGVRSPEATEWRRWARRWLDGTDRETAAPKAASTRAAARAAVARALGLGEHDAAWAVEMRLQAHDIRRELPEWPEDRRRNGNGI